MNFADSSSLRTIATTNKEGDVLGLYSLAGEQLVSYEYDSWGNLISFTDNSGVGIGTLNPIRYRGYYFDEETGLYYLQSRYYDPQTGRFLNADGYVSTGQGLLGNNMFIYCGNNPINRADPSGDFWIAALVTTAVIATVSAGCHHISNINAKNNSKIDNNPKKTTKNRILNDQNRDTGSNFKYGLYNSSWNGCEAIAVHNAKVKKGIDSSLSETMKDFQKCGAMIGFGMFGSYPHAIGDVLDYEGIGYYKVYGTENMTLNGTYVISFWNENAPFNGLHTIAVSKTSSGCIAYNLYGDGNEYSLSNLDKYKNSFICGYYLY